MHNANSDGETRTAVKVGSCMPRVGWPSAAAASTGFGRTSRCSLVGTKLLRCCAVNNTSHSFGCPTTPVSSGRLHLFRMCSCFDPESNFEKVNLSCRVECSHIDITWRCSVLQTIEDHDQGQLNSTPRLSHPLNATFANMYMALLLISYNQAGTKLTLSVLSKHIVCHGN